MNHGASWQAETSGQLFLGYTTGTRPNRERRIRHVTPQLLRGFGRTESVADEQVLHRGVCRHFYLNLMPLAFALATSFDASERCRDVRSSTSRSRVAAP